MLYRVFPKILDLCEKLFRDEHSGLFLPMAKKYNNVDTNFVAQQVFVFLTFFFVTDGGTKEAAVIVIFKLLRDSLMCAIQVETLLKEM